MIIVTAALFESLACLYWHVMCFYKMNSYSYFYYTFFNVFVDLGRYKTTPFQMRRQHAFN
jgi:hypothetical protein